MTLTNTNLRGNAQNHRVDGLTVHGDLLITGDQGVSTAFGVDAATSLLNIDGLLQTQRQLVINNVLGIKGETFPVQACSSASAGASGAIYFVGAGLYANEVVSTIVMGQTGAASGAGTCLAGLYTKAGVLVATTADQNSSWTGGTGKREMALTTAYTVPTTDMYYFAVFSACASTQPSFARSTTSASQVFNKLSAGTYGLLGIQTGQSGLTTPATITMGGGSSIPWWFGWY